MIGICEVKTSMVPKCFNKPWFTNRCKDAIKECNRALERLKCEPTRGNLNTYSIARAKARRDIQHSKKTSWRKYVSKMNSQTQVKSVWNRILKGKESSIIICVSMIEMSSLNLTLLMHWQITFLIILPLISPQMPLHLFARKLKSRI